MWPAHIPDRKIWFVAPWDLCPAIQVAQARVKIHARSGSNGQSNSSLRNGQDSLADFIWVSACSLPIPDPYFQKTLKPAIRSSETKFKISYSA